jgi:transposase-like protein
MKYPPDTVATAVHHYFDGYSLGQICSDIEKNNNILPSTSTIYGWVIKLVEKATSLTVFAHPQGGARWLVYETENWFKDRRYWITYVMDIETHFLLSAVLSCKKIKTDFESLIISAEEKAGKSPEVIFTNIEEKYFKEIDCTCGLRSKHPRITSFTGQDLNSGFIHIFPDMIKNRLKLEYDTEVSDRYKKILNGFIFHHNFIHLPAGINRTPADIAKIEMPINQWMDVITSP